MIVRAKSHDGHQEIADVLPHVSRTRSPVNDGFDNKAEIENAQTGQEFGTEWTEQVAIGQM